MGKKELVEIKKGQTGTGLLIENDGYISLDLAGNKKLFEDINSARKEGDFYCPHPLIFNAVLQRYGAENANGRIYPEAILKREVERYQEKNIQKKFLKLANTSQSKRTLIKLEDVLFCKADDNYCEIYINNDKTKHILSRTLGDLEKKLPQQLFQRVHRSFIVNMNHVSYFEKDKKLLIINQSNGTEIQKIPVSATYKDAIRKMFL